MYRINILISVIFSFLVLSSFIFGCTSLSSKDIDPGVSGTKVSEVLRDGKGPFDPWNQERWSDWYNIKGELIRPFDLDTSVVFASKDGPWTVLVNEDSKQFVPHACILYVAKPGITIDGYGLVMEQPGDILNMDLEDLYALKKEVWANGFNIRGVLFDLPVEAGTGAVIVKNVTFKGLKRGIKVNGTKPEPQHRFIVENCLFIRNKIGFYTNGYNTLVRNCKFYEQGYGAIYSGSNSGHNQFIGNEFRDNCLSQHQYSYGDFIGDTFWDTEISANKFLPTTLKTEYRRIGISMFRNMGEDGRLRKQMSRYNTIHDNEFDGCSAGIHIGARMGRNTRNDVTGEGRDYAFYNMIESNIFRNSTIGIKINTEGNTVKGNTFENVKNDIVLHCVFFELKNTTFEDQEDARVSLWYIEEDYKEYSRWFEYQNDLNGNIKKTEKIITAFADSGGPEFVKDPEGNFMMNPKDNLRAHLINDHRYGSPVQVEEGEISLEIDGYEKVAIWKDPISRISDRDYYTIVIFDGRGTEINRCGRSETPWKQIAVGYFLDDDDPMEIAAVPVKPVEGCYPVYIFERGYRIPEKVLYGDNKDPGIEISTTPSHYLQVDFK